LAGNMDHIFVTDPFQQKVHLFDSKSFEFVNSLKTIDGTDISVDGAGTVFLGAARPHENQSLHIFSGDGEKITGVIPIPEVTIENNLLFGLVSVSVDEKHRRVFVTHEMEPTLFITDLSGTHVKSVPIISRKYRPVPDEPFKEAYSREKTYAWSRTWTHFTKVVSVSRYGLVLVFSIGPEDDSFINIYDTEGTLLADGVSTNGMRLLCSDHQGYVYFLRELDDDFAIFRYTPKKPELE